MPLYDWQTLMTTWNQALLNSTLRADLPKAAVQAGWLGKPGATESELGALEQRLGVPLPPSYRDFLRFTNGWANLAASIDSLLSAAEVDWFATLNLGWIEAWEAVGGLDRETEVMHSAIQISGDGDLCVLLLNPREVNQDGEWQAIVLEDTDWAEYPSFAAMMQAEYDQFLSVDQTVAQHHQREQVLNEPHFTPRQKIEAALEALGDILRIQRQLHSSSDGDGGIFTRGVLLALEYTEQRLQALLTLPDAEIPGRFRDLVADLESRHHQQRNAGMNGMDTWNMLEKVITGAVNMQDLTNMQGRLGLVSSGEGYLRALQLLLRVRL